MNSVGGQEISGYKESETETTGPDHWKKKNPENLQAFEVKVVGKPRLEL